MTIIEDIIFAIAVVAFIGIAIYTIRSMVYILRAFDGRKPTDVELMSLIPPHIRRFGNRSIIVFVACLALLVILEYLQRHFS